MGEENTGNERVAIIELPHRAPARGTRAVAGGKPCPTVAQSLGGLGGSRRIGSTTKKRCSITRTVQKRNSARWLSQLSASAFAVVRTGKFQRRRERRGSRPAGYLKRTHPDRPLARQEGYNGGERSNLA